MLLRDLDLLTRLIYGDVDHLRLSYPGLLAGLTVAFGFHQHASSDRGFPDLHRLRIEPNQVTDEYRLVKDHFAHGDGHEAIHSRAPMRFDGAGHVDIAEDDTAEDRPLRIRVARQHRDANGWIRVHASIVNPDAQNCEARNKQSARVSNSPQTIQQRRGRHVSTHRSRDYCAAWHANDDVRVRLR